MKDKIKNHINEESIIEELKESHGYPVYPISKDDFEKLLKNIVDDNEERDKEKEIKE